MSTPMYTKVEPALDLARQVALHEAVDFHTGAETDDPQTVISTAHEFLRFLEGGSERVLRGQASV